MIQLPLNVDYSGKVVVVTGAGGLICGAMARAFAQSGAKVAALDLNEEAVKKLADEFSLPFLPLQEKFTKAAESADAKLYLHDGVHPHVAGAKLIAEEWLKLFAETYGKNL